MACGPGGYGGATSSRGSSRTPTTSCCSTARAGGSARSPVRSTTRPGAAEVARMLGVLGPTVVRRTRWASCPAVRRLSSPRRARPTSRSRLFTGGSSGTPKAVLHTHRGLAHKASTMVAVHGLREPRRGADARAARARLRPAQRTARSGCSGDARGADGPLGSRACTRAHRDRADHLHGRSADLLRPAHGRVRVHARAGGLSAARVLGRSRRHPGVRDRGHGAARRPGQAELRIDRSTDGHVEHQSATPRAARARPTVVR